MANERDVQSLESRIRTAMQSISNGETTPLDSKIGKLFHHLKTYDSAASEKLFEEYKPIYEAFKKSPAYDAMQAKIEKIKEDTRKKNDEIIFSSRGGSGSGDYLGDEEVTSGPRNNSKPAKERVKKEPKMRVPRVKTVKPAREKGDRDRSGYVFEGESFGKGPLVLAIVRDHVRKNPNITHDVLKKTFPDELLKGYGLFQRYERASEISKVRKRFFLKDSQLVRLKDCNIAICNQWSVDNIIPFLAHARKMGYKID